MQRVSLWGSILFLVGLLFAFTGFSSLQCDRADLELESRETSCRIVYYLGPIATSPLSYRKPIWHESYQTFGVILAEQGDEAGAIKAFERALSEVNPKGTTNLFGQDMGWLIDAARQNLEANMRGQSVQVVALWRKAKALGQ